MKRPNLWRAGLLLLCILWVYAGDAQAATQHIEVKAGWNLISLMVEPTNTAVEAVLKDLITEGSFLAIWAYDAASSTWIPYPTPFSGIPAIDHIEVGKGYWLRVTRATTLTVEGTALASGNLNFVVGWNLVGFSGSEAMRYDQVFFHAPASDLKEIWTYDAAASRFKGVELPATPDALPPREDFTLLEPGIGYWVKIDKPFTLEPILGTAMEGDKDVPPLLPDPIPGQRLAWSPMTPGDEDIGKDGFYDRPDTQRALTFRDNLIFQNIAIFNAGSGILNWTAQIDDPQNHRWLTFLVKDAQGTEVPVISLAGSLTTDTDLLKVSADRSGLTPGDYSATITIASKGRADQEPVRIIKVHMNVATIAGDYKVLVSIDTIAGNRADTHNPRLFLSLYTDRDGLKGIIDHERTLLIPQRFYLTGQFYEIHSNHFIVSGSLELPRGHADNPYQTTIRRDITLLGDRSDAHDAQLGPLDLKGEYRETIRNVLGEPIYLAGTFIANRIQSQPTTIDAITPSAIGGPIPDPGRLEKTLTVSERMIITEVDVTVDVNHSRPADLVVTLRSPAGKQVVLRNRSTAPVGKVTYDTDAIPEGPTGMSVFNGEMANGVWTLIIEDQVPNNNGSLVSWSLDIKGTKVYTIAGTVTNVGAGATVLLTGCGLSLLTTTGAGGTYGFADLVNCVYEITVLKPGYESIGQEVVVNGADHDGIDLRPRPNHAGAADFLFGPVAGLKPLTVDFVDVSPLELFQSGHTYTYTWTLSKLMNGIPQSPVIRRNEGPYLSHTFNEPGTYVAKMQIFDQQIPELIATVDKLDKYITVGPPGDGTFVLASYTTLGGGGWFAPGEPGWFPEQENAFDSATFDIDRFPLNPNAPGREDTNAFLGQADGPDPLTQTNRRCPEAACNQTLDGPVGDLARHVHIYVNIGQPLIGVSVSRDQVLTLGANP